MNSRSNNGPTSRWQTLRSLGLSLAFLGLGGVSGAAAVNLVDDEWDGWDVTESDNGDGSTQVKVTSGVGELVFDGAIEDGSALGSFTDEDGNHTFMVIRPVDDVE